MASRIIHKFTAYTQQSTLKTALFLLKIFLDQ